MHHSQFRILRQLRFGPLFVTQALGAFNDNLFKNALVILVTYVLAERAGLDAKLLVTLAAGIFILPFFLFSATAGQIAERYEKSRLIRTIKLAELVLAGLAATALYVQDIWLLLFILFLLGAQSTFFGPLKYSILPQHLEEDELIGGNALIETGTFLAILLGTITGGLLILGESGPAVISFLVLLCAAAGFLASRFIPVAPPTAPDLRINWNPVTETAAIVGHAAGQLGIFRAILGISWFWLFGGIFLAQFPTYAKETLGGDETVVTLFLTVFSVGIGVGSLLCNKLLSGEVSAKFVPLAAIGMSVFCIDLFFASVRMNTNGQLLDAIAFPQQAGGIRILFDLAMISIFGGVYIVPLYAILQDWSDPAHRSRTIASNNVVNAAFLVLSALATIAMLSAGFTIPQVFLAAAIANTVVAVYICKLLPEETVKGFATAIFRTFYRLEVRGLEHYRAAGDRVVIVANHTSFLDGPLLGAILPDKAVFAINTHIARAWWVKPAFLFFDLLPVDPTNPFAARTMAKAVMEGRKCVIFPEGRITLTGALMKVYEGPGAIADLADAALLPVRIDGSQYSRFSRLRGKMRLRWFPKITVTFLEPRRFDIPDDLKGRAKRQEIGNRLYDVMTDMIFETSEREIPLFPALLDARKAHGGGHVVIEDVERHPASYSRIVTGSFVLGRRIAAMTEPGERVGVLLPNALGAVVTFFALQAFGRVPAMLNFSTGARNMVAACETAEIRVVLTSRRFIELAKLDDAAAAISQTCKLVMLEDLRAEIGLPAKLRGMLESIVAGHVYRRTARNVTAGDPAVVLFTSGSEGVPKGVVLSHRNIQANRFQLTARVDFNPSDIVFNALPVFHSFGLTGGLLLPILSGIRTFLYPSPLHYRIVPELVYDTNATIMFGTDTFLAGYARSSHPYDFYSLRYVFAGAEKLKPETRQTWSEKFGLRIFEGYGATETAPVIATNTPMQFRAGTVGRILPGIDYRVVPVPGIDKGGRLEVSGPNIMLGYLRHEAPGQLHPPADGWYDTGDIVEIDEDGFVTIAGRAKRFAKIAGEMVSLAAVETHAAQVWPGNAHAAVSIPDDRKGEQVVLVTDRQGAVRKDLLDDGKSRGISELMIPREILAVDTLPVLGTGKTDYVALHAMVAKAFPGAA